MATTHSDCTIRAPRERIYRALIDGESVQRWMVPEGMTSEVHSFDGREGGSFRISLTYDEDTGTGKTTSQTDTFHGTFTSLVPDVEVVQLVEFETDDPALQGAMRITYRLSDVEGGTLVEGTHEDLPPGVDPEQNEIGWRMSMAKLAELVGG